MEGGGKEKNLTLMAKNNYLDKPDYNGLV